MLDLSYESFHSLNRHEHLKSPLDMQFRSAYIQYNLQLLELKRFVLLCIHPKVPFLEHHMDMHVHIAYTQYKYHKLSRYVT
jgi:hypothetical protein